MKLKLMPIVITAVIMNAAMTTVTLRGRVVDGELSTPASRYHGVLTENDTSNTTSFTLHPTLSLINILSHTFILHHERAQRPRAEKSMILRSRNDSIFHEAFSHSIA